jgi:hypothetical protein
MDEEEKSLAARELGKLGGKATKKKYGVEYFKKIGSMKKRKRNEKEKHSDYPNNQG